MTLHCFQRFVFVVSFVGIVIITSQVSNAYQLVATTTHQETISGRIRSIDQATGMITVETAAGVVNLEAAPEAITKWKEGDPVVVKIDVPELREHEKVTEEGSTLLQSSPTAKSEEIRSH